MTTSQLLILSALNTPDGPRFVHEPIAAGLVTERDFRGKLIELEDYNWIVHRDYDNGLAYTITTAGRDALRAERWRKLTPWWRRAWRWVRGVR